VCEESEPEWEYNQEKEGKGKEGNLESFRKQKRTG
jgi:hypothetical protein